MGTASLQWYLGGMQPEQEVIADWILRTQARLGWNANRWAQATKDDESVKTVNATTISRAVKPEYQSITSVETLHALAKVAGEPSILEFLKAQADGQPNAGKVTIPSVETLETLLLAVLPLARGRTTAQSVRVVASALQHGLELLGDRGASSEPGSLGVAARGAVSRLRSLTQQ